MEVKYLSACSIKTIRSEYLYAISDPLSEHWVEAIAEYPSRIFFGIPQRVDVKSVYFENRFIHWLKPIFSPQNFEMAVESV